MILQDLFEFKDLTASKYYRDEFQKIYPEILENVKDGMPLHKAIDRSSNKYGNIVSLLYQNIVEKLKEDDVSQVNENDLHTRIKNSITLWLNENGHDLNKNLKEQVIDEMSKRFFSICQRDSSLDVDNVIGETLDEGMAWARQGNKVVRKYRCAGGPRHGRVVSKPAQCFAPPDVKKRVKLQLTKAKQGSKMSRKRKRTMRTNPASRRVQSLNKRK